MCEWVNGWVIGYVVGWMDGWVDRWISNMPSCKKQMRPEAAHNVVKHASLKKIKINKIL